MSAGDFEVAQLDGNLKVDLTAGTGTSVASNGKAISVNDNVKLTDASVNSNGEVWRLNSEGGDDIYSSLGQDGQTDNIDHWFVKELGPSNSKVKYYAAVSWSMLITYDFASEKGDMGVYLDLKESQFSDETTQTQAGTSGDSKKGFRIMFIDQGTTLNDTSDDIATVWGNHVAELEATTGYSDYNVNADSYSVNDKVIYNGATYVCKTAITPESPNKVGAFDPAKWNADFKSTLDVDGSAINLRHVQAAKNITGANPVSATKDYVKTDTSDADDSNWVKGDYVTSVDATTGTYNRLVDGAENATYTAERIATIEKPTEENVHSNTTTVKCIAWFEGEDPNVVNNTAMQIVGADMTFYTRCDSVGE